MLAHRLRRWSNVKTTSCILFAGYIPIVCVNEQWRSQECTVTIAPSPAQVFYPYSAGIAFNRQNLTSTDAGIDISRQNLTSVDVRSWRLKSNPAL